MFLGNDTLVILGIDVLSFVELSILEDQYSRQVVCYTRKKIADKNFPVLKKNMELILGRTVEAYYLDISVEKNMSCMTCILGKEGEKDEAIQEI